MLNILKYFNKSENTKQHFFAYANCCDPIWTSRDYESTAKQGFIKNVIAYRSISLLSKSIASIPVKFFVDDEDSYLNSKLAKLVLRPNKLQGKFAFLENLIHFLLVSGNSYIHMKNHDTLFCLRPDRVSIVPSENNDDIVGYKYSVDGQNFLIPAEEVLHLKFFNPLNDWYGFSPLESAMQSIDQFNAVAKHNLSLLQNGGRPSGCLVLKNASYQDPEIMENLRSSVRKAYAGSDNAGKIMVLEGDFEWKEVGLSPRDLDFHNGKVLSAREISQAYGVPPVLVGVPSDGSFLNYKEARLHLWEDTIIPMTEYIKTEFENWLSKRFKTVIHVHFDLDGVLALAEKREALWNKISNADFLTVDEKRKILGYGPLDENSN